MARQRMVSPGFFTDEELAEVSPLARLLFIALWTLADRRGRMEDRPARIKVQALPYDGADVDGLLGELAAGRFIQRYEAEGKRLIQIRTFDRYQHPHHKEPDSKLPAPTTSNFPVVVESLGNPAKTAEPRASTGPAPGQHGSGPSESESESESDTGVGVGVGVGVGTSVPVIPREGLDALTDTLTKATVIPMPRWNR